MHTTSVVRLACLMPPLVLFIATGLWGLDFGMHWDERGYQIAPVKRIIATRWPLPGYYGYPSLNYWVSTIALSPEILQAWVKNEEGAAERILSFIDTHTFMLRLRTIFLLSSSLSILWIYLMVLKWRNSAVEALLAASFLAFSWEVAYHARWIATDTMLMQFSALTLLLVMLYRMEPDKPRWLYFAAVTAGLGLGTKYPGGLLLLPVLLAGYLARERHPERVILYRLVLVCPLFTTAFLLSTPAVILRPAEVMSGVLYEIRHYATGHVGHTVAPGLEHAWRMMLYLSTALFSWYAPIAFLCFLLSLMGAVVLIREDGRTALLLLSFPICYFIYFSLQRAMVVRNLMALTPFLAVLAARGGCFLWDIAASRGVDATNTRRLILRPVIGLAIGSSLLINAGWLVYAAETIPNRYSDGSIQAVARHVSAHPGTHFLLSPRLQIQVRDASPVRPRNIVDNIAYADRVLLYASEGFERWQDWPANDRWLTEGWFGSYEVNFNVYPNWWGDDRILELTAEKAKKLRILQTRTPQASTTQ